MTPFILEIDYIDSSIVAHALSELDDLVFLDSAKRNSDYGRYSYIAADPFLTLSAKDNSLTVGTERFIGNPWDCLQTQLSKYSQETIKDLPPFQGGAVGYFGYDLLHHLENVPKPKYDKINIPDMKLGFYDCVITFDHEQNRCWIISSGYPEQEPSQQRRRAESRASVFLQMIQSMQKNQKQPCCTAAPSSIHSNFSKSQYCQSIQKTIDYIYAGDIFQANITQCFTADWPSDASVLGLYNTLRSKNPAPFSALLNFSDVQIASASPERFIRMQNKHLETRPIKGTRPRSHNPIEDKRLADELLKSEKDHAENTMIVDLMRNDLSRVCIDDSVIVTQLCGLESYETVHHLVSVVEAKLKPDSNAVDLLKASFPGGSITGAPKVRAMEIISEIEPTQRGAYCGSVGFIGFDGNMDTSIIIRTYTIANNKIHIQAGGGIVADSDPLDEYHESLTKASALRKVLLGKEVICDPTD